MRIIRADLFVKLQAGYNLLAITGDQGFKKYHLKLTSFTELLLNLSYSNC